MKKLNLITLLIILITLGANAQEKFVNNLSKVPASLNPSFHAFKDKTRIGVLAEFASQSQGNQSQHKYAFGSTAFEEYNFQLGVDLFNNNLNNSGFNYTSAALSYMYKLVLKNDWILYPGITAAYSNYRYDFNNLTFQDQINIFTGQISANTIDPITASENVGYLDMGASVLIHNDINTLFGLSLKHLNQPRISSKQSENNVNLNMLISGQFGYEMDINKYGQAKLPEHSYLYLFNAVSIQGPNTRLDFYQDVTLGNFSIGINEHLSYLENASFSEIGFATSLTLETFEFGLNYRLPFGGEAKQYIPNSLELFLVFDISRFKERRRSDYSRFY
ncbi:PorP/SprF family type IX secretion system membrane protein [Arenibacter palladensis]|uniref:PorP/SprF family type IX secretion system membrane protein n=1 Tax=Arenibacter palladensis TaxID=237373 RepID=UPI0026E36684|nr:PorP/SprF family type IX secretion system membrane protein [Arenibacter palladensis]MDO6602766.1 PorP/SprF family type IX secretion system membrane protein [Arenibacter palladensis]